MQCIRMLCSCSYLPLLLMFQRLLGTLFASLTFCISTRGIPLDQQGTQTLRTHTGKHPFLFFDGSDLPYFRQQARTDRFATAARINKAAAHIVANPSVYLPPEDPTLYGESWNEVFGNNLIVLAMQCLLEPVDGTSETFPVLKTFADRIAMAKSWFVKNQPADEMPVAHSLVGLATSVDFLFDRFDSERRQRYLDAIVNAGSKLYWHGLRGTSWVRITVHNHSPTILLALMIAGLVAERQGVRQARDWVGFAEKHLLRTMDVLRHIVDGSVSEGVAYSTYTTRSLMQFAFLAKRHRALDLMTHPWFRSHFTFLLYTMLPGFDETVGIGDSSENWFYGPESQLYFLDRFVLRTGHGNWLARKIRRRRRVRGRLAQHPERVWATLHTEFLWYNPRLGEIAPESIRAPQLVLFSDWGVVTYGGGMPRGNTFFSFKCGKIGGQAINDLARQNTTTPTKNGWRYFNVGHEHPDQGSFVFYPKGRPFITEALYGPKWTFLNNVLMFGPSKESPCSEPLAGQLGDCGKWLDYESRASNQTAELLVAERKDDIVVSVGEYAGSYSSKLGLRSVLRAVLLLTPTALLVVDSISSMKNSSISKGNAFFHNIHTKFVMRPGQQSAYLSSDEKFEIQWVSSAGTTATAVAKTVTFPRAEFFQTTNILNVSFNLTPPAAESATRLAWLMTTSETKVNQFTIRQENEDGIEVGVKLKNNPLSVKIVTRHWDIAVRQLWIGSPGVVRVDYYGHQVHFGVPSAAVSKKTHHKKTNIKTAYNQLHLFIAVFLIFAVLLFPTILVCKMRLLCKLSIWLSFFLVMWLWLVIVTDAIIEQSMNDS